jgi:secernin
MCDTLCVRTDDGMVFAKNSDRHPDEAQIVEWHRRRAAGSELRTQYLTIDDHDAYAFLGSRPSWLWGVEHGVNEHGVAVGNEKIWTVDNPKDREPALLGMDLVRLALERSRSAEDALTIITGLVERYGQGGSGEPHQNEPYDSSFLVADPAGAFVIETSNRTWVARPIDHGGALSNRITMNTDWTRASTDVVPGTNFDDYRWKRMPTVIADGRLAVTSAAVARGGAATDALARTLRSHGPGNADALPGGIDEGRGFTVCMHRRETHSQTTASMIAELRADGRMRTWTALGNPCCGVYVPGFGSATAPQLADPAQWQRFARLRDAVESEPDRFPPVRTALAEVESQLWADADTVFTSGDPDQLDEFARGTYGPVDAALHRLGV